MEFSLSCEFLVYGFQGKKETERMVTVHKSGAYRRYGLFERIYKYGA